MTFLTRGGSRNAFDAHRNAGHCPENIQRICDQDWDEERLGEKRTVTCSENAVHHADRIETSAVEQIPLKMIRRLMDMRMLDAARLFGSCGRRRNGGANRSVVGTGARLRPSSQCDLPWRDRTACRYTLGMGYQPPA